MAVKKIVVLIVAIASGIVHAQAINFPANTAVVGTLADSATPRDGFTRVRLSLTSNETSASESVRLAGVALCTASLCYESGTPSTVTISSTARGQSTIVAELEVPYSDIESVSFKSSSSPGVLQGRIALAAPLKLEKGFRGGDVVVVVQRRGNGYAPVAAASNYFQPEGTTFFYNPKFASTVKLPRGVTLTIPAAATRTPHVFFAGVHDTGEEFPLVDIHPSVQLAIPATVQLPVITQATRAAQATQSSQIPATPRPQAAPPGASFGSQSQAARASGSLTIEINATGTVPRTARAAKSNK